MGQEKALGVFDPAYAFPVQQAAAVRKVSKVRVYIKKEVYL